MNEHDWLASDNPEAMLRHLTHEVHAAPGEATGDHPRKTPLISDRKLYLWCYAVAVRSGRKGLALMDWGEGRASPQSSRNATYYAAEWAQPVVGNIPQGAKAALLRDVVGNPFRPVTLNVDCGTRPWAEAHTLALAAYNERLPDGTLVPVRLLILADALEEAGCVEEALLRHLRGWEPGCYTEPDNRQAAGRPLRGPHVRGCWAIDAILGLE